MSSLVRGQHCTEEALASFRVYQAWMGGAQGLWLWRERRRVLEPFKAVLGQKQRGGTPLRSGAEAD